MNADEQALAAVMETWADTLREPKVLGEHGVVGLHPLLFTCAILSELTPWGYGDRWCYHTYEAAKAAYDAWDGTGEPTGWHRHPKSGRRFDENGKMEVYL